MVNAENCESKKFGFVRIENSKGFSEINNLVRRVNGATFKGRLIKVELSEDLTREEKAARRAEQQSEEFRQWEETPPHLRPAPGYQPQPAPGGRGWTPSGRREEFWPARQHENKMRGGLRTSRPSHSPYQGGPVDTPLAGSYENQQTSSKAPLKVNSNIYGDFNNFNNCLQEVTELLNDYNRILNEAAAESQVGLLTKNLQEDH